MVIFFMNILITGAASGIGYLTALTLAKRGNTVYLTCHTDKEVSNLKEKIDDLENIIIMKIDITKKQDIKKVLDLNIDVLINNAAIAVGGSIIETDIDDMRKNFEINVFSSFRLLKLVLKQMMEKDKGRIIVMSSLIGHLSLPFTGIYSATKASISCMVSCLQKELFLQGSNVNVIIIEPGLYHTGFNNVFIDSKYNGGKYFEDIKSELYNLEHAILKLGEVKKLDSIVIKIVRAVEDEKPKKIYTAPYIQSKLVKLYSMFK